MRADQLVGDPEQLVRVDRADHQVVVAVLLVVEVEAAEPALREQDGHDLLDVDAHGVVAGVHAHLGPLAEARQTDSDWPQSWTSVE